MLRHILSFWEFHFRFYSHYFSKIILHASIVTCLAILFLHISTWYYSIFIPCPYPRSTTVLSTCRHFFAASPFSHKVTNMSESVAYLGFCEGGQNQRCEVRGAGGANGVECGDGVSPPHWRKGLGRGLCLILILGFQRVCLLKGKITTRFLHDLQCLLLLRLFQADGHSSYFVVPCFQLSSTSFVMWRNGEISDAVT